MSHKSNTDADFSLSDVGNVVLKVVHIALHTAYVEYIHGEDNPTGQNQKPLNDIFMTPICNMTTASCGKEIPEATPEQIKLNLAAEHLRNVLPKSVRLAVCFLMSEQRVHASRNK